MELAKQCACLNDDVVRQEVKVEEAWKTGGPSKALARASAGRQ